MAADYVVVERGVLERLIDTAGSYAMQTIDRHGVTGRLCDEARAALSAPSPRVGHCEGCDGWSEVRGTITAPTSCPGIPQPVAGLCDHGHRWGACCPDGCGCQHPPDAGAGEKGRCEITGNPHGTDTRPVVNGIIVGCQCVTCREAAGRPRP
jgi:hypothetical protein